MFVGCTTVLVIPIFIMLPGKIGGFSHSSAVAADYRLVGGIHIFTRSALLVCFEIDCFCGQLA